MSVSVSPSSAVFASPLSALVRSGQSSAPAFTSPQSAAPSVRLDLNESTFQLTPEMRQRIGELSAQVSLTGYPDGACVALRKAACRYFGVRDLDGMAVGNGAEDLIGRLCAAFGQPRPGCRQASILVPELSFEAYRMAAEASGMAIEAFCFEPNGHPEMSRLDAAVDAVRPNLVFLATPNNPTGQAIEPEQMKACMQRHPDVLFVLDEAYIGYSSTASLADDVLDFPNAVCLSSLSKFGLAGLRLGFATAHPSVIRVLDGVRMPFPINALSQAVGTMLLEEFSEAIDDAMERTAEERERVFHSLVELQAASDGAFRVLPSEANFHVVFCDHAEVLHAALASRGVVVRRFQAPHDHHPLSQTLRISVGTPEDNNAMLRAMKAALAGQ